MAPGRQHTQLFFSAKDCSARLSTVIAGKYTTCILAVRLRHVQHSETGQTLSSGDFLRTYQAAV